MPDELPGLMVRFFGWVEERVARIDAADAADIVAAACDLHTTFVHIHPYADGNGRMARILSGLLLQHYGLPPPLFLKDDRAEYMDAVSAATMQGNSTAICRMHETAVHRSIAHLRELVTDDAYEAT
jgi:Fic family protein